LPWRGGSSSRRQRSPRFSTRPWNGSRTDAPDCIEPSSRHCAPRVDRSAFLTVERCLPTGGSGAHRNVARCNVPPTCASQRDRRPARACR
jgi:hypothetical protein